MRHAHRAALVAAALVAGAAGSASAASLDLFQQQFIALNNSGVSGRSTLAFDREASTLNIRVMAEGLEPGGHPAHIHGFEDGTTVARSPIPPIFDPDADGNADGFTSLAEGAPFYGPILLTLEGLMADAMGRVDYDMTFDIDPSGPLFHPVVPLTNHHMVLHGLTTDFAAVDETPLEGLGGGIDISMPMPGTLNVLLPIAVGEIEAAPAPIPLPAAGWMLLAGMGAFGALRARRARRTA